MASLTFIEEPAPVAAPITITDRAVERVKNLLETRGLANGALRVFVVGGGCSGYQYGMALAQDEEEGDLVVEQDGVTVLVDPDSLPMLHGSEIDYVDDLMKSGFTIFNPNAVKSCACGSSFQTADNSGQARACH
jgi:iron-sulfur cluster assembly protein